MIDTMRRVTRDKTWDPRVSQQDAEEDKASVVDLAASPNPSPEEAALRREQRTLIDQLLADACRDWKDSVIVNDYIVNKLSAKEIEEKFGISEDLVYQRARRLRVRLLKWLAEHGVTSAEDLLGRSAGLPGRRTE
jgi:DNA-directed RNA polymerase specialized sigma24 family protein